VNPTDKTRFAKLITGLAQTFHTAVSAVDLETYWRLLSRFSLEEIERAIAGYCRSPQGHRFFPKPSELMALIVGSDADQALRAWSTVLRAIRGIGAYRTVVFDDPLIHAVIWDMGGWQALCAMRVEEEPFRAKEFERRYVGYVARPPTRYPKQLAGITDTVNAAQGYGPIRPPTLIGDEQKALHVLHRGREPSQLLSFKTLTAEQLAQLCLTKMEEEETPP
jgi:hypothetical protein